MAAYDFSGRRLFVDAEIGVGASIALDRAQANYLLSVLRLNAGDEILVFNGRDGEWLAAIAPSGRKAATLTATRQVREQGPVPDLILLFAPLKHARLDYLVQKAVEMGVGAMRPVFTRRTVPGRVNRDRMEANIVEAAEQCGILSVPHLLPEAPFDDALSALEPTRLLVFCDEDAAAGNPLAALGTTPPAGGCAVLIGPEGGFDPTERAALLARPRTCRVSLGPRILRADTAAVSALAIVQAAIGDWR